jgi:hypothetical protein
LATVRFNFIDGQNIHQIAISTLKEKQYRSDTIINQTKIRLINLLPYPELNVDPALDQYEALLVTSKLEI